MRQEPEITVQQQLNEIYRLLIERRRRKQREREQEQNDARGYLRQS